MVTQITDGVKITVETIFRAEDAEPAKNFFLFAYKINIENMSDVTVQLLRRFWRIFDSSGVCHEVEGEGVIGQQPILEPGQTHEYMSGCTLTTDMGKMSGTYQMLRLADGQLFEVNIPEFYLIASYRLN